MSTVNFVEPDGTKKVVVVEDGTSLMQAAVENDVIGIMGDCGGACSCATCHCFIEDGFFDKLEEPDPVEKSMLEFAADPQANSRLGCQVFMSDELDGIVVKLPESQY